VKRLKIVFEDDHLIIVDKPAGILVIPAGKNEKNLTDIVNEYLDGKNLEVNAYPCHRLDRETSGLMIFAKGKSAQKKMMEEFHKKNVKKLYTAFLHGRMKSDHGDIRNPVFVRSKGRKEDALTRFRVTERRKDFTVVQAEPVTGRTNQIRIHFKQLGHPLVGESVFAFRKDFDLKFKRVALHAGFLEFTHPITGVVLSFTSDLPADMAAFLSKN